MTKVFGFAAPLFLFAVCALHGGENLLKNADFSDGETHWVKWREGDRAERRLSDYGRAGRCAYLSVPENEKASYAQRIPLKPGEYRLTGWVRSEAGSAPPRLQLIGKTGDATVWRRETSAPVAKEWTEATLRVSVPAGVDSGVVALFLAGPGKAWFDDLRLETVPPEDVQARPAASAAATASGPEVSLEGEWKFAPGDDPARARVDFDDSAWSAIKVPALWEREGHPEVEGFAWYRKTVELPESLSGQALMLTLGAVSKADETYFDGVSVGKSGAFPPAFSGDTFGRRQYPVPAALTHGRTHVVAVRVHDGAMRQNGGIWKAPCSLRAAAPEELWETRLEAGTRGRYFTPGQPPTFRLHLRNLEGDQPERMPEFTATARTYGGRLLRTVRGHGREAASPDGVAMALEPLPEGLYRIDLHLRDAGGRTASTSFSFGVLPRAEDVRRVPRFGVACHLNRLNDADRALSLDIVARAGAGTLRTGFLWRDAEPAPDAWNFERFDRTVDAVTGYGIELVPTLAMGPSWASTDPLERAGSPRKTNRRPRLDRWENYAARMAERYGTRIGAWEIWNEPNLKSYWPPAPDSYQYYQVLAAADRALRGRNPGAIVIVGGLSTHRFVANADDAPEIYLDDLYAYSGERAAFNRIGSHPYPVMRKGMTNALYEAHLADFLDRLAKVRTARGDTKEKFWLTELGLPNLLRTVDARRQAESLAVLFTLCAARPDVERTHWYNLQNDGTHPDETEHNFGLVHQDFSPKPALYAFKAAVRYLAEAEFVERREEPSGVVRHRFRTPEKREFEVIWSDAPVSWPLPAGAKRAVDVLGGPVDYSTCQLEVSPSPIYLEFM